VRFQRGKAHSLQRRDNRRNNTRDRLGKLYPPKRPMLTVQAAANPLVGSQTWYRTLQTKRFFGCVRNIEDDGSPKSFLCGS
jgi:hypothetical protein